MLSEARRHLRKALKPEASLRDRLIHLRIAAGLPRANVRVPHGIVRVDLRDVGVGRRIYCDGEYEPAETLALERLVTPTSIVLDIGANLGYYTTLFAARAAQVFAIEPAPTTLSLLRHNVRRHANVTVCPVAIGDADCHTYLFLDRNNAGNHQVFADSSRRAVEVRQVTVDTLVRERRIPRVDLIKIDIQGAEAAAFRGMQQTLAANPRAIIVVEFWPRGLGRAGVTVDTWLDALGPVQQYARIAEDGTEVPVPREWFHAQADRHYESIVVRR